MENKDLKKLLDQYLRGTLALPEIDRLFATLEQEEHQDQWHRSIEDVLKDKSMQGLSDRPDMERLLQAILLKREEQGGRLVAMPAAALVKSWWKYAAAIGLISFSAGLLWKYSHGRTSPVPAHAAAERFRNDVPAGGNKAILVLANGSRILLDSAANGTLARQGNANVVKLNGDQLAYKLVNKATAALGYNTVSTPRGGQYELVLSDGTEVWLNAASSLRFPISFQGGERVVEVEGEAYFEVARDKKNPFRVNVNGTSIEVLGTHFEVNAYRDEGVLKTTLLEGKIRVGQAGAGTCCKQSNGTILEPGQQAKLSADGGIVVLNSPDIDEVMAWKNGLFQFKATEIYVLMKQVERWYDVDVRYEGEKIKQTFYGSIPRSVSAINLFKILEETGAVHFRIDGRRVTVSP